MKKKVLSIVLFSLWCCLGTAQPRQTFSFNAEWRYHIGDVPGAEQANFDDTAWRNTTLPRAWNEDEAFAKPIHEHSTAIVWYRKKFSVPKDVPSDKVFLEFEGVRMGAEFYVNGKLVGRHENGVMAVGLDISDVVLRSGENTVAVRTDNSWTYREKVSNSTFQWNDKNFNANYGGIPKNVWIHFTGKLYQTLPLYSNLGTTGTYVYAKKIDVAGKRLELHVESEIRNETGEAKDGTFLVDVRDMSGRQVRSFAVPFSIEAGGRKILSAQSPLTGVNFWNWGYGYLYTVTSTLRVSGADVDVVHTKTGFRKTAFKQGMVFLNDQVLMMKGYAQRTSNEWPAVGLSVPPWLSDFSNRMMVESNANLVRWMHVTPWRQDVESCDRVGLLQMLPAGDAEKDVEGRRWEQRKELMRDAIIYYRNSPSVLFYESGNESISEEHMAEMKAIRDRFDPHGGRAIGSREMLDSKLAEYGGEMLYINKSAKHPMIATEYMRDEGLRKYWDEFTYPFHREGEGPPYKGNDASDYNRNQDQHALEAVRRWWEYWKVRPGTGRRVSSGGVNIIFSDSNTHYRGKENYRRSGEVDAMRIPKDAYFAHQVMWDGWVDADPKGLHIVGHWNYNDGLQKDVYVISGGERVELFVNGRSQGFGQRSYQFLFTFPQVLFEKGEIVARSYNAEGELLNEKKMQTTGEPYQLKLKAVHGENGIFADGNDMVLVEVEVQDKEGRRCPTATNMVDFAWEGPMDWRGGIAQGPNNYILAESLPVEGGVNRVLLRTQYGRGGHVVVRAQANGLLGDSLSFGVSPVDDKSGLFIKHAAAGLPSNMQRGEGINKRPLQWTRRSLLIAGARAGANEHRASASFDDNELSDWVNDGRRSTAWIEYTLEKVSDIDEIDVKLNNFRSRAYPLQIFIDDKLVFDGETETTLGYYTITVPRTRGRRVKVQLKDSSYVAAENLHAEIGGKKLDDGVARDDANARGTLSIIEIDIHSRLHPKEE